MTEKRIAKVIKKKNGSFKVLAEDMQWDLYPKTFLSNTEITEGDFVWCYILSDDDEFYLEEVPNMPLSNEAEWIKQEEECKQL